MAFCLVCDPVMGDNGKMYVPENLLPIYKSQILPLSDILTPNQFEAELLTGIQIRTVEDAWNGIDILHDRGCQTIVLSSTELGSGDFLLALASTKIGTKHELNSVIICTYVYSDENVVDHESGAICNKNSVTLINLQEIRVRGWR